MENINIPTHIGIIMDGNRRWAEKMNKPTYEGHLKGAENMISLSKYILDKKRIKFLSLYAFSTENFNRTKEEVNYLMNLFVKYFTEKLTELHESNIKIIFSGRKENLSKKIFNIIDKITFITKDNTGGVLNICFNYGFRTEMIDTIKYLIDNNKKISEETLSKYFYQDLPDLDFIIRTSGEQRLSNFMLWHASYAELYFPKIYFPDFGEKEFDKALIEYNNRKRRFGGN